MLAVTPRRTNAPGVSGNGRPLVGSDSSEAMDTSDAAGYRNQMSSRSICPRGLAMSAASGASTIAFGVSSTSNTRSNDTNALMMSTRALVSAVSGPYTRVT